MKTARIITVIALLLFLVSGCSVIMPYDSEFSCKGGIGGKCTTLDEAYQDSKSDHDGQPLSKPQKSSNDNQGEGKTTNPAEVEESAHLSYKEALYKRFDALLQEPAPPIVLPPQVMRVWLAPYKGDGNELYLSRFVYFFADEPRWVLGDSVSAIGD